MSTPEIWQEVECTQGDHDRFDSDMVYMGQRFYCHMCGQEHVAQEDVVATYMRVDGNTINLALPMTAEELTMLRGVVTA